MEKCQDMPWDDQEAKISSYSFPASFQPHKCSKRLQIWNADAVDHTDVGFTSNKVLSHLSAN